MHGVYQEIYVKNNETTITAVFWFLCVANVYIDPVKKTPIFLTNQDEMLTDTPYLYTYTSWYNLSAHRPSNAGI